MMRVGSEQIDGKRRILIVRFPDRIQRKKGEQAGNSEGIMGTCDYIPRYHLWYAKVITFSALASDLRKNGPFPIALFL